MVIWSWCSISGHDVANNYLPGMQDLIDENRESPGGSASYGDHNSQHITANRKVYALWWILARIAGWEGQ
jgi:hypothetical protein